jgi:hypothetical protein
MSFRRPLHETLTDITDGIMEIAARTPIRTRSVEMSLPLDIRLPDGGTDLIGDLPLFRLRTAFDPAPARLNIVLKEAAL